MENTFTGWKRKTVLFLLSQNISLFGSSVVGYAIIWHITLETSSGLWLTLATLASMLPSIVVSLWGGVWADRYSRKMLIMVADGFIALATLGLAVAFLAGYRQMGLLLAVSAVRSFGSGVQTPAVSALYPQLVPAQHLTRVQGVNQTLNAVLNLLSPAVGGLLLGTVGIAWTFMLDVATATLAILVMAFIAVAPPTRAAGEGSMMAELKEGFRYTFGHPLLKWIVLCYIFVFFLFTPAAVLTPLLVERSYGSEVWRLTANEIAWTVGMLAGGIFVSIKGKFKKEVQSVMICLAGFGVTFALMGLPNPFWLYLLFMGTAGVFMPVVATIQTVYVQRITREEVLGRVFSILQLISTSAMPLSILVFGPLADVVRVETLLLISGGLLAVAGLWFNTAMRRAEKKYPPDTVAAASPAGGTGEADD